MSDDWDDSAVEPGGPAEQGFDVSEFAEAVGGGLAGGALTISQYMQRQGVDGGVALGEPETASSLLSSNDDSAYEVDRKIAQGGMGAIFSAQDLNIRRTVAMKVMLDPEGAPRDRVLRFIEEAQVTSQLEHPNIVPVHEVGVNDDGSVYYTMKLVQGLTLDDILKDIRAGRRRTIEKYSLNHLLTVFLKTCDAVAFAHSKGVVHRDLKPENIMVGDYGEVQVMDWGLAKLLRGRSLVEGEEAAAAEASRDTVVGSIRTDAEGDALATMAGQVMGTPSFMAPEQALGKVDEIDARTDIYALGGILYSILTLRAPVEGKNVNNVLLKVAQGQITPPIAFNDMEVEEKPSRKTTQSTGRAASGRVTSAQDLQQRAMEAARQQRASAARGPGFPHCPNGRIPASLSAVAMKALAFEPGDRYQEAREIQRDIEAYQQGFATEAEDAGFWKTLLLLVRRHKIPCALVMIGLLAAVLVALGFVRWINNEKALALANEGRIRGMMEEFEQEQQLQKELGMLSAPAYLAKAHAEGEFDKFRPLRDLRHESDFDRMVKSLPKPGKKS